MSLFRFLFIIEYRMSSTLAFPNNAKLEPYKCTGNPQAHIHTHTHKKKKRLTYNNAVY